MVQHFIQQVNQWDIQIFFKVFGASPRKIRRRFFYVLSRSADSASCALAGLAWILFKPSDLPFVAAGVLAFGLELFLYYVIKKTIRRPRPFKKLRGIQCLIQPPDEFSFPSGHTAAAFLMASLVSSAFPEAAGAFFLWAALVGFSRVYLGVHYPTDVLAGMALGVACAQWGLWFLRTMF